ncbi:MAG: response regulator [Candidatus Kariarchaeaceae archaeon]|jgi:YesN/AraC family two-component response regulator
MAKIVVIDDSRLSVSALRKIISELNHEIVGTAFDGESGIKEVNDKKPDVVCLDMVMPGIDGKETAMKIRESNPKVKIIMITQSELRGGLKSDIKAVSYVIKPITAAKIQEAFKEII